MLRLKEWLRPPRSLLLALYLLTVMSITAVGWFGSKLMEQERLIEAQRAQERLEQTADRVSASLRGVLADTGDRLSTYLTASPAPYPTDGLVVVFTESSFTAIPPEKLLYRPFLNTTGESTQAFVDGEALEFLQGEPQRAAEWYSHLAAGTKDPAVRAGALMRLGRVERRFGHRDASLRAYRQLAAIGGVIVGDAPADLVARHAIAELSGSRDDAQGLMTDLLAARWPLTRGQFEFYWTEVSKLAGGSAAPPPDRVRISEAAARAWLDRDRESEVRGERTVRVDGEPFFFLWRGARAHRAVLITTPRAVLAQVTAGKVARCAAVDRDGQVVAGSRDGMTRAAVRPAVEGQLPWTIYTADAGAHGLDGATARKRLLALGILVMAVFLSLGTYFIARAIRREMEVSRLQADFVSAVSHEFRTPLTSMRQLSEILAAGRVPGEERRQVYYETLVGESRRLQRLVETLLNFGSLEAGARPYRFQRLDASTLVGTVVDEFEQQIASTGRHIEVSGADVPVEIQADPEALAVALRNLLDNALKYSPGQPTVWVDCGTSRHQVSISVRDRGVGVLPSERRAIFQKFVRGAAAAAGNVKGTGVGLAMVRRIVAAHGGEVRLVSEPGQGSTFTVVLPAEGGGV